MQDSEISWVRVPLKYALNNRILSDTNQHQVHFLSSFLDIDFLYKFRFTTRIGASDLVPQSDKLSEQRLCRVGEGGEVRTCRRTKTQHRMRPYRLSARVVGIFLGGLCRIR